MAERDEHKRDQKEIERIERPTRKQATNVFRCSRLRTLKSRIASIVLI